MSKLVVVSGKYVRDLSGLITELRARSFEVENIGADIRGTLVYVGKDEVKDPTPVVELWISKPSPSAKFLGPITFVTAVSRENNLDRIFRSMSSAIYGVHDIDVRWILVFDAPGDTTPKTDAMIRNSKRVQIRKVIYAAGPRRLGIQQKNLGIDLITEGFYHCFDDDNLVHPKFFIGMAKALREHPGKKVFAFGQTRWDKVGDLMPSASTMKTYQIDNTMFVAHKDVIGDLRYNPAFACYEDGVFFESLFEKAAKDFVFVHEYLAYYNYLKHFPNA